MNTQQRLVLSGREREQSSRVCNQQADVTLQENRFRPCGWIAVISALLFVSCASFTPDRISVLAQIAGQAAQMGAQAWLADHSDQRPAFNLVMVSINAFIKNGETNMAKYTQLLESLPMATLRGEAGEVYITGEPAENELGPKAAAHLVIWDADLKKSVRVAGPLERPVQRAIRDGLRRACAPLPPPLPGKSRLPGIVPEGAPIPPPLPRVQPAQPTWPPWVPKPDSLRPDYRYPNWPINTNDLRWWYLTNNSNAASVVPTGIIHESPEPPPKTDAELDREFEAIKAGLKKGK